MTDPTTKNLVDQHLEEEGFNVYDIIFKYLVYWPWFIISVIIALAGTYVYLKFQAPIYNISSFGANINGTKNTKIEDINVALKAKTTCVDAVNAFKFNIKEFIDEEFFHINNIIAMLSKRTFSPALVSAVTKSILVYQYLQADVLTVLQRNFDDELAEKFVENTKIAIKTIVEQLQRNKLV